MSYNVFSKLLFLVMSAILLMQVGCSKLTPENYRRLKVGLDYDKVIEILGEADECGSTLGMKDCKWGNDKKYIAVKFAGEKVVLFSKTGS